MTEWLSQLSAFGVFLGIASLGFLFLLLSLIFGEAFEHFGGADHDFDHGGDGAGPSFFSVRVLSVFVTTFGGAGAIAVRYGMGTGPASAVGFAGGISFAAIIYFFARALYAQQASSEVRVQDVVGQSARVVVAIPAGGMGQVRCRLGEELVDKIARSKDGKAIPENETVRVDEILGETVVVSRQ